MGSRVASLMKSKISSAWVQLASLQSRTPSAADIDKPLAQIPAKPASSTIFALRPLCASIKKSNCGRSMSCRKSVVFFGDTRAAFAESEPSSFERGQGEGTLSPVRRIGHVGGELVAESNRVPSK